MSMKIHPRRKSLCRTRQDGRSQARYLKTVPRVGDENNFPAFKDIVVLSYLKTVPRVGDENIAINFSPSRSAAYLKTVPRVGDESTLGPHLQKRSGVPLI